MKQPLVSFIIPTLNSAKVLGYCLDSIVIQNYHHYEILIIDGGSTDQTISLAQKYRAKIFSNPLVTAEAAKAIGVKKSRGQFLALIDSDNILPDSNWLNQMIKPFTDSKIIGTEPFCFTYRPQAGFIERYCSLLGANDPFTFVTGTYDRYSFLSHHFLGLKIPLKNFKNYYRLTLNPQVSFPTIGANGTIWRKEVFSNFTQKYLIDTDYLISLSRQAKKPLYFAKVKQGIIHSYCENSFPKFIRKQTRRVVDLYSYRQNRAPNPNLSPFSQIKFSLYCLLIFPVLLDTLKGYLTKPDFAWLFHPFACYSTLFIYAYYTISFRFFSFKKLNRHRWSQ